MSNTADDRQYSPSAQRNRAPILAVLERVLPAVGTVLEVASGTGEHAVFCGPRLAPRVWQPSDVDPAHLASIAAWVATTEVATTEVATTGVATTGVATTGVAAANLRPPLRLDAQVAPWPVETGALETGALDTGAVETGPVEPPICAVVNINMIHISPWSACLGLLAGAGRLLPPGGVLYLYGPFKRAGRHTAPSNAAFDESLRARDPAWGIRDLDEVVAAAVGLELSETVEMPANNLSVIFHRVADGADQSALSP